MKKAGNEGFITKFNIKTMVLKNDQNSQSGNIFQSSLKTIKFQLRKMFISTFTIDKLSSAHVTYFKEKAQRQLGETYQVKSEIVSIDGTNKIKIEGERENTKKACDEVSEKLKKVFSEQLEVKIPDAFTKNSHGKK